MQGEEKVGNPVGWWKISVSLKNLRKLDLIKQKLEDEIGERLSYNKVIQHLIEHYLKNCRYSIVSSKKKCCKRKFNEECKFVNK